jgi:hypothetical protein
MGGMWFMKFSYKTSYDDNLKDIYDGAMSCYEGEINESSLPFAMPLFWNVLITLFFGAIFGILFAVGWLYRYAEVCFLSLIPLTFFVSCMFLMCRYFSKDNIQLVEKYNEYKCMSPGKYVAALEKLDKNDLYWFETDVLNHKNSLDEFQYILSHPEHFLCIERNGAFWYLKYFDDNDLVHEMFLPSVYTKEIVQGEEEIILEDCNTITLIKRLIMSSGTLVKSVQEV